MNEPIKFDNEKAPVHLVSPQALIALTRVLRTGAEKYGERNWEKGLAYHRLYSAAQRHLLAWWAGEDLDTETGESHVHHAMANLMMLAHFVQTGRNDLDDRPR